MDVRRTGGVVLFVVGSVWALFFATIVVAAAIHGDLRAALRTGLFALVPLAILLVGARLMRGPDVRALTAPPPARRVGVVPLPGPDDVSGLPTPITACPDCGYLGVRMPTLEDGLWPGGGELGDRKVCPRCAYQGLVPSFPDGESYRAFVASLQPAGPQSPSA